MKNIYIENNCGFRLNLLFKIGKECFENIQRPNEGQKQLGKCEILHFCKLEIGYIYRIIASTALSGTDPIKRTAVNGKICIKECLKFEKAQVVCCSLPQNIYFRLTSTNSFHCDMYFRNLSHFLVEMQSYRSTTQKIEQKIATPAMRSTIWPNSF